MSTSTPRVSVSLFLQVRATKQLMQLTQFSIEISQRHSHLLLLLHIHKLQCRFRLLYSLSESLAMDLEEELVDVFLWVCGVELVSVCYPECLRKKYRWLRSFEGACVGGKGARTSNT